MKRNERLLSAIGNIDEKYVKEAEGRVKSNQIIKVAVVFGVIIALGLYLFLPFAPVTSNLAAYSGSEYFPLIEGIEDYRLSFMQPTFDNNFEVLMDTLGSLGSVMAPGVNGGASGDNMNGAAGGDMNESDGNGSYVESTDNQVAGVIESDLMKMTDRYIFRLGWRSDVNYRTAILRVYSIDKENSELVSEYEIPHFEYEYFKSYDNAAEMYLSSDGNTVTVVKEYSHEKTGMSKVGIILLDVSDVQSITLRATVSIDGSLNTTRMVDGRLLLISEFFFNRNQVDYNDPTTFVPSIDSGEGEQPIRFEDIIFPDQIGNTRYSVVTLLDADSLTLLGANALLNYDADVYVSADNVYITREYTGESEGVYKEKNIIKNKTDIAVISYSGERLENRGTITVDGWAEDQYSFDEREGYLRLVTTTNWTENKYSDVASIKNMKNVSLWIYDLSDNSLAYSLRNFAIDGEEATAVRFREDKVYVCTAVKVVFTDPVYFIDLSDYESITSADTGVIEGYSEHLIDMGEGFLLGIGEQDWRYSKVEIYEQSGGDVVSVDEYLFEGAISQNYKAFLVNREENLIGIGIENYYRYDEETRQEDYGDRYLLLHFDGYSLNSILINTESINMRRDTVRAAYIDGYLYITTDTGFMVERIR